MYSLRILVFLMAQSRAAGVYDIFSNVVNRKTHQELKKIISDLIGPDDTVLECACGTGLLSAVIASECSAAMMRLVF